MIRRRLLVLVLLAGCGGRAPLEPERVYEAAHLQSRRGRFDDALAQVDRILPRLGSPRESTWRPRFLLLKAEILVAQGKTVEALKITDNGIPEKADSLELQLRSKLIQARAKTIQKEMQDAGRLLEEALRLAPKTGNPALHAEVQLARTSFFIQNNDSNSAELSAQEALEHAKRSGDAYLQAAALGNLGSRFLFNSRYDEAIPWYEQSIAVSEKHEYRQFSARTRINLGICYYRLGDYDKALQSVSRAERDFAGLGDAVRQERCLGEIGNVHLLRGDLANAIASYRKAVALARQLQQATDVVRWQSNLALAWIELGDLDSAEASIRGPLLEGKIGNARDAVWLAFYSARIAAGRGRSQDAEKRYHETIESAAKLGMTAALLQARAKLGSLYLLLEDFRKAEAQFQAIASESESNRARLGRDEWKLTFQSSVIPFYEDYIDFLVNRGRVAEALEVAESCRARLLAEKLGLPRMVVHRATAADFRAKARERGSVLLSYWLAPRCSFLWVVTPGKVHSFTLPPEKEISRLVEAYSNVIMQGRDPLETRSAAGSQLFEALVAPARKLILPGAKVIVVPDGSLHELNLETLLVRGGTPRYWIEDATVTVAPSLAVLQPAGWSAEKRRRLLLLGNPVPPRPEYPPLPASEQEIAAIHDLFREGEKSVITGAQAHPAAYKEADPGRFGLIHFSAHAVANRESPLDSAVILSPQGDSYKLYARDVAGLPLAAELVTVSACRSAGARTYSGEGLVGFTWAFLQAGAGNVIAGLWDVSDRSTSDLMIQLYKGLAKGTAPAEALRSAKLALLRSEGAYRKPYYWAPFQLYTRSMPFARPVQRAAR